MRKKRSFANKRSALEPTASIAVKYDKPFKLAFIVKLTEYQLSTELHVRNTSNTDILEFQALFHNYIRAPSGQVLISPLQHQSYYDKTAPTQEGRSTPKKETRAGVDVKCYTDSVYENVSQQYKITWPHGGIEMRTSKLKDLVIWNPQKQIGSKLVDMEEGGWYVLTSMVHDFLPIFFTGRSLSVWSRVTSLDLFKQALGRPGSAHRRYPSSMKTILVCKPISGVTICVTVYRGNRGEFRFRTLTIVFSCQ